MTFTENFDGCGSSFVPKSGIENKFSSVEDEMAWPQFLSNFIGKHDANLELSYRNHTFELL